MSKVKKRPDSKNLDPDVRFLLANERTLLAWVRTSLAVMAGGVALSQIGEGSAAHTIISMTTIMLGVFMAFVGYIRFRNADSAIRRGELPVTGNEPLVQVGGVMVIAVSLITTRLIGIW